MTRKDLSQLEAAVRDANPLPPGFDLAHSDESVEVALLVRQRRQIMTGTPDRPPLETKSPADQAPRPPATPLIRPDGAAAVRNRPAWALGAAFLLTVLAVGLVTLLGPGRGPVVVEQPATTVTQVAPTTQPPVADVPVPAPESPASQPPAATDPDMPTAIPVLGEGWELVLSTVPGDPRVLDSTTGFATSVGYYLQFRDKDWALIPPRDESMLIDIDVPATGFLTGGPGIVSWANVGPESLTEAQLWVSTDGVDFERVGADLLEGCAGLSNCVGSEIYAVAASPDGRVVALAYDPLVRVPDCECSELNPVALVTEDGTNWTRQPVDLLSVLPASWQGVADIRSPLVYVDGRWLTYATHYSDMYNTSAAFFASEDGIDWQAVDTGETFNQAYLLGLAANDRGVVAITAGTMYWSADGRTWTGSSLSEGSNSGHVAAYEDGYVVVTGRYDDGSVDGTWYSPDGVNWSLVSLGFGEPTYWNVVIGDGPNLIAVGGTPSHMRGVWRWSD